MGARGEESAELVLDARATLGEGPAWDEASGTLLWVDIEAGEIHRFDPRTGEDVAIAADRPVGAAVPRAGGGVAVAVQGGFGLLVDGELHLIAAVEADLARNRMNDGKCDPQGRFWAGTMALDEAPGAGALYRLAPDGELTTVLTGVTISNGLGWSPDGRTMFYVDSPTRRVDAFDFDPATGEVSGRRPVVAVPEDAGIPDGMTVDEQGGLWVALFGGGGVRRYLDDGTLDHVLEVPAAQTTSCCFGGDDLGDLYVTTARRRLGTDELDGRPNAGGLFRFRPGVRGLPTHPYRG